MHICKCNKCSSPTPKNDSYFLNGSPYCGDCVESARLASGAENSSIERGVDVTICSRCGRDSVEGEWGVTDGVPLCEACATSQQVGALPWWLKNSVAVLAIMLVFSLVHGKSYIQAVEATYRAEKVLAKGENARAVEILDPVVEKFSSCDRCVLDLAIACVRDGHAAKAYKISEAHGNFDDHVKELSDELQREYDKVDAAGNLLDESEKLEDAGKFSEARAKLAEARKIYPNWEIYPSYATAIDGDEAWDKKDWDAFLAIRKNVFESQVRDPSTTIGYASALAVKYASTGDEPFRKQAIEKLEEAKAEAKGNKDAEKMLVEFIPRFEHRLKTREIISASEFNRRYRPEQAQAKEQESK